MAFPAATALVDRPGHHLLPRAAFPKDQDRASGVGHQANPLEDLAHGGTTAYDVLEAIALAEFRMKPGDFGWPLSVAPGPCGCGASAPRASPVWLGSRRPLPSGRLRPYRRSHSRTQGSRPHEAPLASPCANRARPSVRGIFRSVTITATPSWRCPIASSPLATGTTPKSSLRSHSAIASRLARSSSTKSTVQGSSGICHVRGSGPSSIISQAGRRAKGCKAESGKSLLPSSPKPSALGP